MRLISTIAIGDRMWGDMALNLLISIKTDNPNQKTALIYEDSAIEGIEELVFRYVDFSYRISKVYDNYEQVTLEKVHLYDTLGKICPEATEVVYLDADVLILPGNECDAFFDKNSQYDYFFYKNGEYDYEKQKKSRRDGSFWCHPEKIKKALAGHNAVIKYNMPQVVSVFLYFKMNDSTKLFFTVAQIILAEDLPYIPKRGYKCADFCFNVAASVLGSPFQKYYRPVFIQQYSENRSDIYIWHRYRGLALDSNVYYDTRIISMYNNVSSYYRQLAGIKQQFSYKIKKTEKMNRKVYGFWHIFAINHYLEIVNEQLSLLVSSGLYDKCDAIYVGVVGNSVDDLLPIFKEYSKIKISTHKKVFTEYEFPTLSVLDAKAKEQNEEPFFAFYFHTKGVTYPNHPHRHGGDMFRAFLNHYVIRLWQKNIDALSSGSDVSGAGWSVESAYPAHYRGNFWWADSEYIKKLPDIDTLDRTNRFTAEFWIGGASPLPNILSSTMIDYKSAPILVPAEIKNSDRREVPMVRPWGIDESYHTKQWSEKDITVLICQRKTKDLIQLCLESLLRFYPDINVLIVDGESGDDSLRYIKYKELITPNVRVWERLGKVLGKHTSHGVTMDEALRNQIKTKYVLIMDSDVIIQRGGWIEEMLNQFASDDKLYATGTLMLVSRSGEACSLPKDDSDILRYAHPSCSIINREMYIGLKPFGDHGAPCVWNMISAEDAGLNIGYYPVDKYVAHLSGSSWTEPRTIWRHDFGVLIRPFVTFVVEQTNNIQLMDTDYDVVFAGPPFYQEVVIHGDLPTKTDPKKYPIRFNVTGEYVCEVSSLKLSAEFLTKAKDQCINLGAPDEFQVDGLALIKRNIWQQKKSVQ